MQPEQPDMQAIFAQAQQMQAQLMAIQTEISTAHVNGEAGGGLVRATITGAGQIVSLSIDPKVVDPSDVETLQDLIIGAFNAANTNAQQMAAEKLGPMASAFGGQLPGVADL